MGSPRNSGSWNPLLCSEEERRQYLQEQRQNELSFIFGGRDHFNDLEQFTSITRSYREVEERFQLLRRMGGTSLETHDRVAAVLLQHRSVAINRAVTSLDELRTMMTWYVVSLNIGGRDNASMDKLPEVLQQVAQIEQVADILRSLQREISRGY